MNENTLKLEGFLQNVEYMAQIKYLSFLLPNNRKWILFTASSALASSPYPRNI